MSTTPDSPQTLTKIIATVGPVGSTNASRETLSRMIESGASIFRLNFSHGTLEDHEKTLAVIRDIEKEIDQPIGILGDLCGPKIRIGQTTEAGIMLEAGQDVVIQREPIIADGPRFSCTYPALIDEVETGQKILINDGAVRMLVVERDANTVTCRVLIGGLVTSGKGINLPNTKLSVSAITERDEHCVEWAVEHDLDFIALSFVRCADEIRRLKRQITQLTEQRNQRPIPIVAKIEKPEALDDIEGILTETDVIMVARGDLGVEIDLADVPTIQKQLINKARQYERPTIVATQMLQSMIDNPIPTRAEAGDVANAILDGADAVMLSGETAIGKHPDLTVETMRRIADSTEQWQHDQPTPLHPTIHIHEHEHWTAAIAAGTRCIVHDTKARLVACWTQTGLTALHLSQNDFPIPVLACSSDPHTLRRMTVLYGVRPFNLEPPATLDLFTTLVDQIVTQNNWVEPDDPIILLTGHPIGIAGGTNSLAVHRVGSPSTG